MKVTISNVFKRLLPTNIIKRRPASSQLKSQHPNGPQINGLIIPLALHNFGTDIIQRATISTSPILTNGTPPKITQLGYTLKIMKQLPMKERCSKALCHDGGFGRRACGTGPGRLAGGLRRFRGGGGFFAVLGGGRGSRLTCTTL
jgi:hypothetical protein